MQEILQKYTARQLRLAFLTQLWNSKVDFSESLMTGEVRGIEITFNVRVPILADFLRVPPLPLLLCVPWYRAAIITVSNGPHERICAHMPPIAHRIFCPMLTGAPRGFPPELLHQRQGARFPSGGRGSLPRRQEPFPAGGTRTHRQVKLIPTRHLHLPPGVFPALIHPRGRQGTTGSRGENLQRRPCAVC